MRRHDLDVVGDLISDLTAARLRALAVRLQAVETGTADLSSRIPAAGDAVARTAEQLARVGANHNPPRVGG